MEHLTSGCPNPYQVPKWEFPKVLGILPMYLRNRAWERETSIAIELADVDLVW